MSRHFTLSEAEKLLPDVEQMLRTAIELKADLFNAEKDWQEFNRKAMFAGGVLLDRAHVVQLKQTRENLGEQLKQAIEDIHGIGCQVKDLDIGLIDFPTWYQGQEVLLCWKLGEHGISFWHDTQEGFAGRKPIDQQFLENHSGDRKQ